MSTNGNDLKKNTEANEKILKFLEDYEARDGDENEQAVYWRKI